MPSSEGRARSDDLPDTGDAGSAGSTGRVRASAELARLAVDEAEARRSGPEFERILSHFRVLAEVDVEGVEPLVSPVPPEAFERRDAPAPPADREALLGTAPDRRGDFYGVPKVIGDET